MSFPSRILVIGAAWLVCSVGASAQDAEFLVERARTHDLYAGNYRASFDLDFVPPSTGETERAYRNFSVISEEDRYRMEYKNVLFQQRESTKSEQMIQTYNSEQGQQFGKDSQGIKGEYIYGDSHLIAKRLPLDRVSILG